MNGNEENKTKELEFSEDKCRKFLNVLGFPTFYANAAHEAFCSGCAAGSSDDSKVPSIHYDIDEPLHCSGCGAEIKCEDE